jgi:hypothetical protein
VQREAEASVDSLARTPYDQNPFRIAVAADVDCRRRVLGRSLIVGPRAPRELLQPAADRSININRFRPRREHPYDLMLHEIASPPHRRRIVIECGDRLRRPASIRIRNED